MQRDDTVFINHILDAAEKAVAYSKAYKREDLDNNEMLAFTMIHLLEVIGEAANSVSNVFRDEHKDIPWKHMVELRNRLVHGYFDINLDIVWDTVVKDLPPLIEVLKNIP